MGNIGRPLRKIDLEPLDVPSDEPVGDPAGEPSPVPALVPEPA